MIMDNLLEKTKFERLGCFKYSHEENTYAYSLDDNVSEEVKNQRVDQSNKCLLQGKAIFVFLLYFFLAIFCESYGTIGFIFKLVLISSN